MKVEIIKAEDVCGRGFYTHGLAEAIKAFVENKDRVCQDLRIFGIEDETLTAVIFYEEKGDSAGNG